MCWFVQPGASHPHDGDDNDRGNGRVAPWGMRLASWLVVSRTGLPTEEAVVFSDVRTWRRIPHTNHDLSTYNKNRRDALLPKFILV